MKRPAQKSLALAVGFIVALLLVPACEEETTMEPSMEIKRTRMIAAELQGEIKTLKARHKKELARQQKLLDKCVREREALQKVSSKEMQKHIDDFTKTAGAENERLQRENQSLKTQIEGLKKELKELRKPNP